MPKKGETIEDMIANRYWITPAGEKALEEYVPPEDEEE